MTKLQYLKSVCTLENTVLVNQERHKRQWKKYEQQFRKKKLVSLPERETGKL